MAAVPFRRLLARSLGIPLALVALGALALTPMLFLGQTDQAALAADRPILAQTRAPVSNLAITALFRAGYIRQFPPVQGFLDPEADPKLAPPPEPVTWGPSNLPQQLCTRDSLTAALVAAEVYMRPASRRALEQALAEAAHALTGTYPDWSYGMGQVRLSTARAALNAALGRTRPYLGDLPDLAALSDSALFALLATPCSNIALVGMVVDADRKLADSAADTARRYRGGSSRPTIPGIVTHERLVTEMAEVIRKRCGDPVYASA